MAKFVFLCFLLARICGTTEEISIKFEPEESLTVRTDESATILVKIDGTSSNSELYFPLNLKLDAENDENIQIRNSSVILKNFEALQHIPIEIFGKFLGRTSLSAKLFYFNNSETPVAVKNYDIIVLRSTRGLTLSSIFTVVMVIFVTINTFLMGTQLDLEIVKEHVKKPFGPAIGYCCQFILMPLIAFGWATVFLRGIPNFQFGYFAVGCAPGGGASNFWTILLEGNLDLSVTMTFFSNISALFMMPVWLFTLGRVFHAGRVTIPFFNIFMSLAGLLFPSFLGILVRRKWPHTAVKVQKIIKLCTLCIVIFVFTFGIYANFYIFKLMSWRTLVPGFLLPWTGYLLSYTVAWMLRQPYRNCITIAIETGIQNGGIPIILLYFSLPEPDSDITIVMPVSVMIFTSTPLWVALIVRVIHKRCTGEKGRVGIDAEKEKKKVDSPPESLVIDSGGIVAVLHHDVNTQVATPDIDNALQKY